jgi:hypothetical protein
METSNIGEQTMGRTQVSKSNNGVTSVEDAEHSGHHWSAILMKMGIQ